MRSSMKLALIPETASIREHCSESGSVHADTVVLVLLHDFFCKIFLMLFTLLVSNVGLVNMVGFVVGEGWSTLPYPHVCTVHMTKKYACSTVLDLCWAPSSTQP